MSRLYVMCSGGKGSGIPVRKRILDELEDGEPRSLMEISDNIESSSDCKTYEILEQLTFEGEVEELMGRFPTQWRKTRAEV